MGDKKTLKRINKMLKGQLDAFFQAEDPALDLSKVRHGYVITLYADTDEGVSCTSIKADVVDGDIPTGFDEQYQHGGFITPLLTMVHQNVKQTSQEAVELIARMIAVNALIEKLK